MLGLYCSVSSCTCCCQFCTLQSDRIYHIIILPTASHIKFCYQKITSTSFSMNMFQFSDLFQFMVLCPVSTLCPKFTISLPFQVRILLTWRYEIQCFSSGFDSIVSSTSILLLSLGVTCCQRMCNWCHVYVMARCQLRCYRGLCVTQNGTI